MNFADMKGLEWTGAEGQYHITCFHDQIKLSDDSLETLRMRVQKCYDDHKTERAWPDATTRVIRFKNAHGVELDVSPLLPRSGSVGWIMFRTQVEMIMGAVVYPEAFQL